MTTNFDLVAAMHEKFGIDTQPVAALLSDEAWQGRVEMMLEELTEAMRAHRNKEVAEVADALVDLAVFVLGTAHLMGIPWDACFAEVMRANMSKERGTGKRRNKLDLIKPEGWTPPDLEGILLVQALNASIGKGETS